jgi:hypothetical protein
MDQVVSSSAISDRNVQSFIDSGKLHFRRFLPAPLADAARSVWDGDQNIGEFVREYVWHQEQFNPISPRLAQRLTFQLLSDIVEDEKVESLLNVVHLASHSDSDSLDEWISKVTGVGVC